MKILSCETSILESSSTRCFLAQLLQHYDVEYIRKNSGASKKLKYLQLYIPCFQSLARVLYFAIFFLNEHMSVEQSNNSPALCITPVIHFITKQNV